MTDNTIERYDMRPLSERLWQYLSWRFPLSSQGALVALFAVCGVCYGAVTRGGLPTLEALAVAIVVALIAFFQLRVADEHRDADEDLRYRPHLPVPSGLVSLAELRMLAIAGAILQALLCFALHPPILALLYPMWLWIVLVSVDFCLREALERRPALSLGLHLGFVPLVALFCVAADQVRSAGALSPAVLSIMVLSAAGAAAVEIARKCLAPEDERRGILTYSRAWGPQSAGMAAAGGLAVGAIGAFMAFIATGVTGLWFIPTLAAFAFAFAMAIAYAYRPTRSASRRLLQLSAVFTAVALASVGILPFLARAAPEWG